MSSIVTCCYCGARLRVDENLVGKAGKCPNCHSAFEVVRSNSKTTSEQPVFDTGQSYSDAQQTNLPSIDTSQHCKADVKKSNSTSSKRYGIQHVLRLMKVATVVWLAWMPSVATMTWLASKFNIKLQTGEQYGIIETWSGRMWNIPDYKAATFSACFFWGLALPTIVYAIAMIALFVFWFVERQSQLLKE